MPNFFIDRPIFAWVIALFMLVIGAACITQLPVTQYPNVAPPQVTVSFNYPGASAQVLDESVISIIENELNGLEGMIYMESESQASGEATGTPFSRSPSESTSASTVSASSSASASSIHS